MITATKIEALTGRLEGYHMIYYKMDGIWRLYERTFKDPKDARRIAKSILQSQGFNGLTDGGLS